MRFSKIDKELSVYRGKKVVIWGGIHREARFIYEILKRNHIDIYAFVTRSSMQIEEHMFWGGGKILSPEQLEELYKTDANIVVQIGSSKEGKIKGQLLDMGIDDYVSYSEAMLIPLLEQYLLFSEKPDIHKYYLNHIYKPHINTNRIWDQYLSQKQGSKKCCVIICAPQKTGNNTVFHTADRYAEDDVMILESWHSSKHIEEFIRILDMPVKLVTAVREPISQNLSDLFHLIYTRFWDQGECWENDCNIMFEKFIDIARGREIQNSVCYKFREADDPYPMTIQNYFESQFQGRLGINLFDYPFDQEKGYSIISVNGLEIFIYQLEKLNLIHKELFRFIGLKEDAKLHSKNCSTRKFYDENYQDAKKEIRFSKEYYDWSFHSPYLKHFYSKDDIEQFKEKWRENIEP